MKRSSCNALAVLVLSGEVGCKAKSDAEPAARASASASGSSDTAGSHGAGSASAGAGSAGAGAGSASAGTGSNGTAGTGSAGPGGGSAALTSASATPARPAAAADFEAVLLPLSRESEGAARSRSTCKQMTKLRMKALAMRRSAPPGVDAATWERQAGRLIGPIQALEVSCTDEGFDDALELGNLVQEYQRLIALLPPRGAAGAN